MNIIDRLEKPKGRIDVVLDSDMYNEVDDQFAFAYMVKSPERFNIKGVHAAPFFNDKSTSPTDGMEKSYEEALRLIDIMGAQELIPCVHKGSPTYLENEETPVISSASKHLVELSQEYTMEKPLYIVAIGAITNVASAILMDPTIVNRTVLVWLGGHAHNWVDNSEFNMQQDIAATRIVLNSQIPYVQLPCLGVVSRFTITEPEIKEWLLGKNKLCDYLGNATIVHGRTHHKERTWSRPIWDVAAVAWLQEDDFMLDVITHTPIVEYDKRYSFDSRRHFMKYVYHINRDKLFEDLFNRLIK